MCACGCLFLLGVAAALFYCYMNGYWIAMGLIVVATLAISWFGRDMANWRPAPKK